MDGHFRINYQVPVRYIVVCVGRTPVTAVLVFFGGWIVMRHLCSVLLLLPARGASALPLTTDHAPPLALVSKYRVLTPDDCNGDAPKSFPTLCALWSGGILASQRYDKQGQGVAQTEEGGRRG